MKSIFAKNMSLLLIGFIGGVIATNFPFAKATINEKHLEIKHKSFMVSIHEIQQNFIFAEKFKGSYSKTVKLSDGSTRTIELTPMIHEGMPVVEFKDTGGRSYMGLNGTTTNGKLMVQLRDVEKMHRDLKEQGWMDDE